MKNLTVALASLFAASAMMTSCRHEEKKPESKFKPNITANAATGVVVQQKTPYDVISVNFKDSTLTETLYAAGSIYTTNKDSVSAIQYTVKFKDMDSADIRTVDSLRQHLPKMR